MKSFILGHFDKLKRVASPEKTTVESAAPPEPEVKTAQNVTSASTAAQATTPEQQKELGRILAPYLRSASSSSLVSKSVLSEADPAVFRPPNSGWSNQIEFLLTCISYAVGLGNVWRFPYLCYKNGGGAFLFPYIIMLILVGMPTFYLELTFGQFAALGPLSIWTINPFFKGLGYAMVVVSFITALYYVIIISMCFLFWFSSMQAELPWDTCGHGWNTEECIDSALRNESNSTTEFLNVTARSKVQMSYTIDGRYGIVGTKTEEFYYNFVLGQSPLGIDDMGVPNWPLALCFALAWILVAIGLIKGVASLGKISYFTAIFPNVMLTILFVRGVTLPGAYDGIMYYLTPDFNRLKDLYVWQEAAIQVFFNLSCGTGGVIVMASFNHFKNNVYRDALIVPILNICTSIFAGFVVFSILGFMAYSKNTTIDKVASGGPGLAFIVYPEALAKLPVGPLWAILFFMMMITLGFGSELGVVETVLTAFQDDMGTFVTGKRWRNIAYRVLVCLLLFFLGLPMTCRGGFYLLQIYDYYLYYFSILLIPLLEMIVICWIYGFPNYAFAEDTAMMLGRPAPIYFRYMDRYVSPVIILILLICGLGLYTPPMMDVGGVKYPFPGWALSFGWLIAFLPVACIVGWMIYYHCYLGGYDNLQEHVRPMINWGPREHQFRIGRYSMQTQAIAALQAIRGWLQQTPQPQPAADQKSVECAQQTEDASSGEDVSEVIVTV